MLHQEFTSEYRYKTTSVAFKLGYINPAAQSEAKTVLTRIISIVHVSPSVPQLRKLLKPRGRSVASSPEREGARGQLSLQSPALALMTVPGLPSVEARRGRRHSEWLLVFQWFHFPSRGSRFLTIIVANGDGRCWTSCLERV